MSMIEYRAAGELWKCEKFPALAAEFENGLTPETMAPFHECLAPSVRAFKIIRRLYGIQPVMPPKDIDPEDFRIWERHEIV